MKVVMNTLKQISCHRTNLYMVLFSFSLNVAQSSVGFGHSLSDLSLPQWKQEVAEMCFLLECDPASLAKAKTGTALPQKVKATDFLFV